MEITQLTQNGATALTYNPILDIESIYTKVTPKRDKAGNVTLDTNLRTATEPQGWTDVVDFKPLLSLEYGAPILDWRGR